MSLPAPQPVPQPVPQPGARPARLRRPQAPTTAGGVTPLLPPLGPGPTVPLSAVQGTLALDLREPVRPSPAEPHLFAVPEPEPDQELRSWAARFAQAVVEVGGGDRPLTQLLRWTSPRVYAELARRVQVMAQARPVQQRRRTMRPQVRSVHVCQPAPEVAEVAVHVRHGARSRAIAARLERRNGHWTCTALRIG